MVMPADVSFQSCRRGVVCCTCWTHSMRVPPGVPDAKFVTSQHQSLGSRAKSRHGTPQVPSFRAEELLNPQEEEQCTLRRKLFQTFEEAAPTVRTAPGWRTSMSSGPGAQRSST
eukprot:s502_g17.t1